jgi:hypothetical protein
VPVRGATSIEKHWGIRYFSEEGRVAVVGVTERGNASGNEFLPECLEFQRVDMMAKGGENMGFDSRKSDIFMQECLPEGGSRTEMTEKGEEGFVANARDAREGVEPGGIRQKSGICWSTHTLYNMSR